MSARLESLKSLIDQDPANSRFRYMFAVETLNSGDLNAAMEAFEQVLSVDENYAAAYFHGGQTLEKLGRTDEARRFYQRGIDVTRRTGDAHTQSELQAALDMLG